MLQGNAGSPSPPTRMHRRIGSVRGWLSGMEVAMSGNVPTTKDHPRVVFIVTILASWLNLERARRSLTIIFTDSYHIYFLSYNIRTTIRVCLRNILLLWSGDNGDGGKQARLSRTNTRFNFCSVQYEQRIADFHSLLTKMDLCAQVYLPPAPESITDRTPARMLRCSPKFKLCPCLVQHIRKLASPNVRSV